MIEVNEYVRTKTGLIAQIKSIDYENEYINLTKMFIPMPSDL